MSIVCDCPVCKPWRDYDVTPKVKRNSIKSWRFSRIRRFLKDFFTWVLSGLYNPHPHNFPKKNKTEKPHFGTLPFKPQFTQNRTDSGLAAKIFPKRRFSHAQR